MNEKERETLINEIEKNYDSLENKEDSFPLFKPLESLSGEELEKYKIALKLRDYKIGNNFTASSLAKDLDCSEEVVKQIINLRPENLSMSFLIDIRNKMKEK